MSDELGTEDSAGHPITLVEEEADFVERLKARTEELFDQDMKDLGHNLTLATVNERIRSIYVSAARESLLNDYVEEINQGGSETSEDAVSNKVNIDRNAMDMWVFADPHGEEYFRMFRNNKGEFDIKLNRSQTFTDAAEKFLQIVFERTSKLNNLHFGRAFELLLQGHTVTRDAKDYNIEWSLKDGVLFLIDKETDVVMPGIASAWTAADTIEDIQATDWHVVARPYVAKIEVKNAKGN